jgi:3-hydroxyisobutyrate dehydrogenase
MRTENAISTRLGFVGLGNMGGRMAVRLLRAGYELFVFDSRASAAEALVGEGARVAASLADLATSVETVLVSLPTPNVVEEVLTGPAGIGMGAVRIIVDLSTTGPEATERIAATLAERGIALVEAPVSGGTTGAEHGTLTIMLAGPADAVDAVRAALECLGRRIFALGPKAGQAQMVKLINNQLLAASAVAAFEALVLGAKAGLDADTMLAVINASSGRSFATEVKIAECVLDRSFPVRFSTALLAKDVDLCLAEAERRGVPMPVNDCVRRVIVEAVRQGFGELDYGRLIERVERAAGAVFGRVAAAAKEPLK